MVTIPCRKVLSGCLRAGRSDVGAHLSARSVQSGSWRCQRIQGRRSRLRRALRLPTRRIRRCSNCRSPRPARLSLAAVSFRRRGCESCRWSCRWKCRSAADASGCRGRPIPIRMWTTRWQWSDRSRRCSPTWARASGTSSHSVHVGRPCRPTYGPRRLHSLAARGLHEGVLEPRRPGSWSWTPRDSNTRHVWSQIADPPTTTCRCAPAPDSAGTGRRRRRSRSREGSGQRRA